MCLIPYLFYSLLNKNGIYDFLFPICGKNKIDNWYCRNTRNKFYKLIDVRTGQNIEIKTG